MSGSIHIARAALALLLALAGPAGAVSVLDDDGFGAGFGAEFGAAADDPYAGVEARVEAGDYEGALPEIRRLLDSDPSNPDTFRLLGLTLRETGDVDAAGEALDRALELAPGDREALSLRGELFLVQDLPEKALAILEKLSAECLSGCAEKNALERAIRVWKLEQNQ